MTDTRIRDAHDLAAVLADLDITADRLLDMPARAWSLAAALVADQRNQPVAIPHVRSPGPRTRVPA